MAYATIFRPQRKIVQISSLTHTNLPDLHSNQSHNTLDVLEYPNFVGPTRGVGRSHNCVA